MNIYSTYVQLTIVDAIQFKINEILDKQLKYYIIFSVILFGGKLEGTDLLGLSVFATFNPSSLLLMEKTVYKSL